MNWLHSSPIFGPIVGEVCSKPPNLRRCRHRQQEGPIFAVPAAFHMIF
jgi:hypothetical protein